VITLIAEHWGDPSVVEKGMDAFRRNSEKLKGNKDASTWTADQARRNSRARISGSPSNSGGLTLFGAFNPGGARRHWKDL
jgi:hypothetical protein